MTSLLFDDTREFASISKSLLKKWVPPDSRRTPRLFPVPSSVSARSGSSRRACCGFGMKGNRLPYLISAILCRLEVLLDRQCLAIQDLCPSYKFDCNRMRVSIAGFFGSRGRRRIKPSNDLKPKSPERALLAHIRDRVALGGGANFHNHLEVLSRRCVNSTV